VRVLFIGGFSASRSLKDLMDGFDLVGADYAYLPYMGDVEDPNALQQALNEGDFTAIIGFCMYYTRPESTELLKRAKPLKLSWQFDAPHREINSPEHLRKAMTGWDGALTSANGEHVHGFYQRERMQYWGLFPPPAMDMPLRNQEIAEDASQFIVTFLGQKYDREEFPRTLIDRGEMGKVLKAKYGGRFGLFGKKWDNPCGYLPWYHCLYYWYYPAMTIGHHGEIDDHWYFNGRDTRAMGVGACYIQDRANEMDTFFVEGKECFFYDSVGDIVNIVEAYKDDPNKRHRVARAGQQKVLQHFSRERTALRILKIIEEETGERFTPPEDSPVEYVVDAVDKEQEVRNGISDLWRTGQFGNHYEFRPLGKPQVDLQGPVRGKAGFRVYAFANNKMVGHVGVLNRNIGGYDIGAVSGSAIDPEWRRRGLGPQLARVLQQAGAAAGYQLLLTWTEHTSRFWAHAGFIIEPGGAAGVYIYDPSVARVNDYSLAHIWPVVKPYRNSW